MDEQREGSTNDTLFMYGAVSVRREYQGDVIVNSNALVSVIISHGERLNSNLTHDRALAFPLIQNLE